MPLSKIHRKLNGTKKDDKHLKCTPFTVCVWNRFEFCFNWASYDQFGGGENGLRGAQTYMADDIKHIHMKENFLTEKWRKLCGICVMKQIPAINLRKNTTKQCDKKKQESKC